MREERKSETAEERKERLLQETKAKREKVAAEDAAIDQMIRRNIEQYGG